MSDDPASKDAFRWELRRSLVERLRIPWDGMGDMANQQRAEAAVQISTMMDELEAWQQAMQKSERDIKELRDALEIEEDAVNHLHTDRNNLRLEVERLTRERDEARHGESVATATLQGVIEERTALRAERDRKNLTIQALTEERDEVVRMANKLMNERDEARRMLCEEWAKQDGLPLDWQGRRGAEGMAEFVKWDCFKEKP